MFNMENFITNTLEVKEDDSLGEVVMKSATKGWLKGTLISGAGLGVLLLGGWLYSKKVKSEKEEEEENPEEEAEVIEAVDYEKDTVEKPEFKVIDSKKKKAK